MGRRIVFILSFIICTPLLFGVVFLTALILVPLGVLSWVLLGEKGLNADQILMPADFILSLPFKIIDR